MIATDFVVTGATGFLGRAVLKYIADSGYSVVTLGRRQGGPRHLRFDAECSSLSALGQILSTVEPRWVVHLAGAPPAAAPATAYRVNAGMLRQIIGSVGQRVSRIVAIGTAAEYGESLMSNAPIEETALCRPVSTYGVSKYVQTLIALAARRQGVPVTIARTFNLVGPGMPDHVSLGRFVRELRGEAARTGMLRVGPLDKRRDFVEVEQAAKVIVGLATSAAEMPVLVNVCSGASAELSDWLQGLIAASNINVTIEPVPALRRLFDPDNVVGSNALLRSCGFDIRVPTIETVSARIWHHEQSAIVERDQECSLSPSHQACSDGPGLPAAADLAKVS